MLNYWKDGKEIIVPSIGENGRVGQVLILGEKVEWGTGSFTSKNPTIRYRPDCSILSTTLCACPPIPKRIISSISSLQFLN